MSVSYFFRQPIIEKLLDKHNDTEITVGSAGEEALLQRSRVVTVL
jgi:hypothetical protein